MSHRPAPAQLAALLALLAALLGFVLVVLHDALTRAATIQTHDVQQLVLLWSEPPQP